ASPEVSSQLVKARAAATPTSLPLHEILKNLPATALRLRDDQEETVIAETFETAFSIKADEDAKRLHTGAGLALKVYEKPAEQPQIQEKAKPAREDVPALASAKEEKRDAKSVVARASALPGAGEAAGASTSPKKDRDGAERAVRRSLGEGGKTRRQKRARPRLCSSRRGSLHHCLRR